MSAFRASGRPPVGAGPVVKGVLVLAACGLLAACSAAPVESSADPSMSPSRIAPASPVDAPEDPVEPEATATAAEREPTRLAVSFAEGVSSEELLGWVEAAVGVMAEPPTDFMGMMWPIGAPVGDEPDPQAFDGDPFREHASVMSPAETDEAVAFFRDWQADLEGCDPGEMSDFDDGARRVEAWVRGGADVATAPDPCQESRSAVVAWNAEQDRETAKHIFFHESYHGLQNYLLRQCAPILGREEDSLNNRRWFAEGTADYFSMYMQAQDGGRKDYTQAILERAVLDMQGDPGMTLDANTYVQTAAMVFMIERGLISEEKIIDGSYFHDCGWIDAFDPDRPEMAYIFENFRDIESSGGELAYTREVIDG